MQSAMAALIEMYNTPNMTACALGRLQSVIDIEFPGSVTVNTLTSKQRELLNSNSLWTYSFLARSAALLRTGL